MSRQNISRGRPKGTGLDDTECLRKIEAMIAADPGLKPTTAIKSLGLTDPSVIRRLRDKLAAATANPMVPAAAATTAAPTAARPRAVALRSIPETRKKTELRSEAPAAVRPVPVKADQVSESTIHSEPADWMAMWCGLGLQALTTTAMVQMAVVEHMLRMPVVASAFKHNMMINTLAASFAAPYRESAKTLH